MRPVVTFSLMLTACSWLVGCRCVPTHHEPQGYSSTYHKALRKFEMQHQTEMFSSTMTNYPSAPMGAPCPPLPPLPATAPASMNIPVPAPAPSLVP